MAGYILSNTARLQTLGARTLLPSKSHALPILHPGRSYSRVHVSENKDNVQPESGHSERTLAILRGLCHVDQEQVPAWVSKAVAKELQSQLAELQGQLAAHVVEIAQLQSQLTALAQFQVSKLQAQVAAQGKVAAAGAAGSGAISGSSAGAGDDSSADGSRPDSSTRTGSMPSADAGNKDSGSSSDTGSCATANADSAAGNDSSTPATGQVSPIITKESTAEGGVKSTLFGSRKQVFTLKDTLPGCRTVFSPDGTILATVSDCIIYIYSVADGNLKAQLRAHRQRVNSLAISPDSRYLASAGDGEVRVWDLKPRQLHEAGEGIITEVSVADTRHPGFNTYVRFWPDAAHVSILSDGKPMRWSFERDGENHSLKAVQLPKQLEKESPAAYSEGRLCLVSDGSRLINVLDTESGACLSRVDTKHAKEVTAAKLGGDGSVLVTSSEDSTLHVFHPQRGGRSWQFIRELRGHKGRDVRVAVSRDGSFAVSGGGDGAIKVWDLSTGECTQTLQSCGDAVTTVLLSPDDMIVATACSVDSTTKVWQLHE